MGSHLGNRNPNKFMGSLWFPIGFPLVSLTFPQVVPVFCPLDFPLVSLWSLEVDVGFPLASSGFPRFLPRTRAQRGRGRLRAQGVAGAQRQRGGPLAKPKPTGPRGFVGIPSSKKKESFGWGTPPSWCWFSWVPVSVRSKHPCCIEINKPTWSKDSWFQKETKGNPAC